MKKTILNILLFIILTSCSLSKPDDTVLTNHSENKIITISLIGADEITLSPDGSINIETLGSMNPSNRMQWYNPSKRVFYTYNNASLSFDFYDRDFSMVEILNLSGKIGVLTADDWMDDIIFDDSDNEQSDENWRLFTAKPKFKAETDANFPLSVSYNLENGVFKVTIGN